MKVRGVMDATRPGAVSGRAAAVPAAVEPPEVMVLVERAKGGDPLAFDGLMRIYERRVIALGIHMGLSREDALDACQDAFLKVFKYIGRFRSGEVFFKWLYRIALNAAYDQLRRARTPGVVSVHDLAPGQLEALPDGAPDATRLTESAELARRMFEGLDLLTRQERIVFVLRDLQQIPTGDIARILRLSEITVRRHCAAARIKLRDRLHGTPGC